MSPAYSTYVDPETLFSLQIPPGWALDTSGQGGSRAILYHPEAWSGFRPSVNVVVQLLGGLTPEEFLTMTRLQIKQVTGQPQPERDEQSGALLGGQVIEYTAEFGTGAVLRVRQDYYFHAGRAFILTATAPNETYARVAAAFERILASFRLPPS